MMKVLFYSTAVKAIAMSVALAFSAMTFAAETESAVPAVCKKAKVTKVAPTTVAKKAPSWMFVIDAKQGVITKDKKGQYHLVLKHADMNHVIQFSDRPNRVVKYISGEQLKALWKIGKNSFEKDPPNAVLSASGLKTQIIIINGIEVENATATFSISLFKDETAIIGSVYVGEYKELTVTVDYANYGEKGHLCCLCPSCLDCVGSLICT